MMLPIPLRTPPCAGVAVRRFDVSDAPLLFTAVDDDRVWTHIPGSRPQTPAELTTRLTGLATQQPLVITDDGTVVGTSSFHFDPADPSGVEIGSTLLTPEVWGTGVNDAAKRVMIAAAFGAGADWVQLRTDERNRRSAAAIGKLPGVIEIASRVEPQWIRADGSVRTSRLFRIPRPGGTPA